AEDGIRDRTVTGVQTCALPILAAITSALPNLHDYTVEIALVFVLIITLLNLRGVRESGAIFAAPTYLFIVMAFAMLGLGTFRLRSEERRVGKECRGGGWWWRGG